ncbi:MAG TPA: hypothetical protein VEB59_08570, partial [Gemmatimonadales bacterium]|nr:hypothetical protein [Gemmatimonadales bacterium]
MNGAGRRTYEMAVQVENLSDAHPDTDPGQTVLVTRLKEVRGGMERADAAQRAGRIDVRNGAEAKRRLRREMLAGPIAHLVEVGALAQREL